MKRPAWFKLPQRRDSNSPIWRLGSLLASIGRSRVVALDFDGVVLRGAVVQASKGEPRILAHAESRLYPLDSALSDLLEKLRANAGRLPPRCVLATTQMLAVELRLPVAAARPRKRAQMLDLARWELEPLVGQSALQWNLGTVLTAMGGLSAQQRLEISGEQRRQNGMSLRFGDRALELGYITQDQLQHALSLQKQLQGASADFDCDYAVMGGGAHDGLWPWLGVAMDCGLRADWFAACRANGLKLEWIYPRSGLGALVLGGGSQCNADGVEVRLDAVITWSRRDGQLISLGQEARPETAVAPEQVIALLAPRQDSDRIDLHYHIDGNEAGLAPALSAAQPGRAHLISPGGLDTAWVPLHGLAAHALGLRAVATFARMMGREKPALHRHPNFLRTAVPVLVLAALLAGEVKLQYRLARGEEKLARIENEFQHEGQQKAQIQTVVAQSEAARKEVDSLRLRAAELANRVELLDEKLLGRLERVPRLLRTLAKAVGPEVVLESVHEAGHQDGVSVVAWGRHDAPLLEFARNAQDLLADIDQGVVNTEFSAAEGRTLAPGYRINFWVVRDPDALLQSAIETPARPTPANAPTTPQGRSKP